MVKQSSNYLQQTVYSDVLSLKQSIEKNHPALLREDTNKDFLEWWHIGDEKVKEKLHLVNDYHDANALLKYYTLGFKDPHLSYKKYTDCLGCFDNPFSNTRINLIRNKDKPVTEWAGFVLNKNFSAFYKSSSWESELPQINSTLISCDGTSANDIVEQNILPFLERRDNIAHGLPPKLFLSFRSLPKFPFLDAHNYKSCLFKSRTGEEQTIELSWLEKEHINKKDFKFLVNSFFNPYNFKYRNNQKNVWINIPSFSLLDKQKALVYNEILTNIQTIPDSKNVIVDLRGNRGGSILHLTKLIQSFFPNTHEVFKLKAEAPFAMVPTSEEYIHYLKTTVNSFAHEESPTEQQKYEQRIMESIVTLLEENQHETKEPMYLNNEVLFNMFHYDYIENKRKTNFGGKIFLLTDNQCFSACLNFLDIMLPKNNVIHIGKTTDADTRMGITMPIRSRNRVRFKIPVIFFNRVREDNIPIVPSHIFKGNIRNNKRLEMWARKVINHY